MEGANNTGQADVAAPPAQPAPPTGSNQSHVPQSPDSQDNPYGSIPFGQDHISAAAESPLPTSNFANGKRKFIIIAVALLVFAGLTAAGVFGAEQYDKYARKIPVDQILPGDADMVAKFPVDPASDQFTLLEDNLKKFPGYELLRQELDEANEGKTISQLIQEDLKEYNLDFDADIKPLLSDEAYFLITDLSPITQELKNGVLGTLRQTGNSLSHFRAEKTEKGISLRHVQDPGQVRVMGENTVQSKPLDLMMASEIKDLDKAKQVMEKIKSGNKYAVSELSYNGYTYYKMTLKSGGDSDTKELVNYVDTYHALLGNNWIIASNEQELKVAIDRRKSSHYLGFLTNSGNRSEVLSSLSGDADYQKSITTVSRQSVSDAAIIPEEALLTVYYKLNYDELLEKDCPNKTYGCSDISQYIKYPDEIKSAYIIRFTADGMVMRAISNQVLPSDQDVPVENGFAKKVPQKLNDKWTDLFMEYNNVKSIYHQFKDNNLTDKGVVEWKKALSDIQRTTGIDLENDFIDQFTGRSAIVAFTKEGTAPEGALVAEIENPDKILSTFQKAVDTINQYLFIEASQNALFDPATGQAITYTPEQQAELQNQLMAALPKLTEIPNEIGKIYSYNFPEDSISFHFSLEKNVLIFAHDFRTVESLQKEFSINSEKKLSDNEYYIKAHSQTAKDAYSSLFLNTQGIWNTVTYLVSYLDQQYQQPAPCSPDGTCIELQKSPIQTKQEEDLFAIGAILRTIRLIGASGSVENDYSKSSIFMNIQELPAEDKQRAEDALEDGLSWF